MILAFLKLGFVQAYPAGSIGAAVSDVCFHSCFWWRLATACCFDDNTSNDDNNHSNSKNSSSNNGSDSKPTNHSDSNGPFHNDSNGHIDDNATTVDNNTTLPTTTTTGAAAAAAAWLCLITMTTAQKESCVCVQAPLPWELSKCVSLARVLQQMAHLLKQQPLDNSSVQQVSIIAMGPD